jgi:hypothetical protein
LEKFGNGMKLFYILMIAICFVSPKVIASGQFEAGELETVRNISQAILKVRGQKKKQVLKETEQLRTDVIQLRNLLDDAVSLDQVSGLIRSTTPIETTIYQKNRPEDLTKRFLGWWRSLLRKDEGKAVDVKDEMYSRKLSSAREILARRKAAIEKNLPAFWQVWVTPDPQKERVHEALKSIENQINAAENSSGSERALKLQGIVKRLSNKNEKWAKGDPDGFVPTILTLTKHVRKQGGAN